MRARALWIWIALAGMGACDGDGGPSGPSSTVAGTYVGDHVFEVTFGQVTIPIVCTGNVVLIGTDAAFSGTLRIDPCEDFSDEEIMLPVTQGQLTGGGAIAFVVLGQEAIAASLEELGCVLIEMDEGFSGTLLDGDLDAQITATADCEGEFQGQVELTWRVDMQRS